MTGAFVPMVSQSVVLAEVAVVKAGREKKKLLKAKISGSN
jgi:hypothetical protein